MRRKLAAGNWKMHGLAASLAEIETLATRFDGDPPCDILICPPATLLYRAAAASGGSAVAIGGQDCHAEAEGAHTGDVSAAMLRDAGATFVIVGHSERRADHGETDAAVRAKAEAAMETGLVPVICVGETLDEREMGRALDVVARQIAGSVPPGAGEIVVAYEPVWAIGTGKVAGPEEIAEMHRAIRAKLTDVLDDARAEATRILYGGSVKPANAAEIFAVENVDGALVGGASLKADDFSAIIEALGSA